MTWLDEEYPGVAHERWLVADDTGFACSAVAATYSPLLARALWSRQLATVATCEAWLDVGRASLPPWDGVPDLASAVERLAAAARAGQPVAVFGDYDVDGLAATAIVILTLQAYRLPVQATIPTRAEGYGLTSAAVDAATGWLRAHQPTGRPLLVVVDCGTSNLVEIARARDAGLDVVVLDHHAVTGPVPAAHTLVNPKCHGTDSPGQDMTAAGLACYLARGLLATAPPPIDALETEHLKREVLALAALGTAADVAPLTGENRVLVSWGLRALRRQRRPGLQALLRVAGCEDQPPTAETLSWRLAPRLNAAGRMADPNVALRLLVTDDAAEAALLADELDRLNYQRQVAQEHILDEARALLSAGPGRPVPVLAGDGWSAGLVGLVAGRLAEETGRPVVVLTREGQVARGSARSRDGFNIAEALAGCREILLRFGGHSQAAGLTLAPDQIGALADALDDQARRVWPDGPPEPVLQLAGRVRLADLARDAVADLARLEPFGRANEEPVWLLPGVRLLDARPVGRDGAHVQMRVTDGRLAHTAIAFRYGARRDELLAASHLDLALVARVTSWQGRERVELQVRGARPSVA
jgi:single-stranded-DNA-specific exonuclease